MYLCKPALHRHLAATQQARTRFQPAFTLPALKLKPKTARFLLKPGEVPNRFCPLSYKCAFTSTIKPAILLVIHPLPKPDFSILHFLPP